MTLAELLQSLPDDATVPVGWLRAQLAVVEKKAPAEEQWLDAKEAARRLGVTPDWLYRRTRHLPFAKKLSRRVVRYSAEGLSRYLAARQG